MEISLCTHRCTIRPSQSSLRSRPQPPTKNLNWVLVSIGVSKTVYNKVMGSTRRWKILWRSIDRTILSRSHWWHNIFLQKIKYTFIESSNGGRWNLWLDGISYEAIKNLKTQFNITLSNPIHANITKFNTKKYKMIYSNSKEFKWIQQNAREH